MPIGANSPGKTNNISPNKCTAFPIKVFFAEFFRFLTKVSALVRGGCCILLHARSEDTDAKKCACERAVSKKIVLSLLA